MDAVETLTLDYHRHASELREMWQSKVLAATLYGDREYVRPRNKIGMCVLSMLAHSFDEAMPTMLAVVFPGYRSIAAPFLVTCAKVAKTSHVMADMVSNDGNIFKNQALFLNTQHMERDFRRLADALKLTDQERVELFKVVKNWVVCDYRLDPTMDRNDPDAKRLTVH